MGAEWLTPMDKGVSRLTVLTGPVDALSTNYSRPDKASKSGRGQLLEEQVAIVVSNHYRSVGP